MFKKILLVLTMTMAVAGTAFAAHPLITDDTGTQGKGKFQLEIVGEYEHGNKDGVVTDSIVVPTIPVLSCGIADNADLILGISYQHVRTSSSKKTITADGTSDASIGLKWRFFEKDGLSLAIKPGITLPTGDEGKGLGAGKATYSMFFIASKEIKQWALHLNLGYIRNENAADEINNIWHASVAGEVEVFKNLKAVANAGIERDRDKDSNTDPAFILAGLIYSLSEKIDIDLGTKRVINKPETDYSVLAGITWRF